MMKPVMQQLQAKNIKVVLVSLCEFRRMETPDKELNTLGISVIKLASLKFKGATTSTGKTHIGGNKAFLRNALRYAIWLGKVKNSLIRANRERPDLVVVPNDIAYPFDRICKWLNRKKIPFVLQQEGIRFPLPNEEGMIQYGTNGAKEILAWGEDSASYFRGLGITSKVIAAGNPRFDNFFMSEGKFAAEKKNLPLGEFNILYVSNPVDDQGFCTHEEKIRLFKAFLNGIKGLIQAHDIKVFVRLHPREDIQSFKAALDGLVIDRVVWAQEYSLFDYLEQMDLTVILASTVGLESMMMHTPVAVIKLPGHGYVFNYVSSGCAIGIDVDTEFSDSVWRALTVDKIKLKEKSLTYVNNQLSHKGTSVLFISNHLQDLIHATA